MGKTRFKKSKVYGDGFGIIDKQEHEAEGVVPLFLGKPIAEDDDDVVALAEVDENKEYTLAKTELDVPRAIVVERAQDTADDTIGDLTVKGTDYYGDELEEEIAVGDHGVQVYSKYAYKTIESITGSTHTPSDTNQEDSIKIGSGAFIGLPIALEDADHVLCSLTGSTARTAANIDAQVGDPPTVAESLVDVAPDTNEALVWIRMP